MPPWLWLRGRGRLQRRGGGVDGRRLPHRVGVGDRLRQQLAPACILCISAAGLAGSFCESCQRSNSFCTASASGARSVLVSSEGTCVGPLASLRMICMPARSPKCRHPTALPSKLVLCREAFGFHVASLWPPLWPPPPGGHTIGLGPWPAAVLPWTHWPQGRVSGIPLAPTTASTTMACAGCAPVAHAPGRGRPMA